MIKKSILFILIIISIFLYGCGEKETFVAKNRKVISEKGEILIGVGWPIAGNGESFKNGIKLAEKEVNENGGVDSKKIRLVIKDDKATITRGLQVAHEFSENPNIWSVIGHRNSYISLSVAGVYQRNGILMVTPGSTAPKLTSLGNKLLLRTIPSDTYIAQNAAKLALRSNLKKIVIYYEKNDYGLALANAFEDYSNELGISIVDRRPVIAGSKTEFRKDLQYFSLLDFDGFFLAGVMPMVSDFVNFARREGFEQPIIGGDGLDSEDFLKALDTNIKNVTTVSVFNPEKKSDKTRNFIKNYIKEYNSEPDMWAAQAYDALNLIVYALKNSDKKTAYDIVKYIENMPEWNGASGKHCFDNTGNLVEKDIVVKTVRSGKFVILSEGVINNE